MPQPPPFGRRNERVLRTGPAATSCRMIPLWWIDDELRDNDEGRHPQDRRPIRDHHLHEYGRAMWSTRTPEYLVLTQSRKVKRLCDRCCANRAGRLALIAK